jgi:hypothetical protein
MKAKILTLALFGIMSLSFVSCSEEEVVPANQTQVQTEQSYCECEGGADDREEWDDQLDK